MVCENCGQDHQGTYGSGRFCSQKCARGFATKAKRAEINQKVSSSLRGRQLVERVNQACATCGEIFEEKASSTQTHCSISCTQKHPERRALQSAHRIEALKSGRVHHKSIRCVFPWGGGIRCDSRLEFSCLEWLCRTRNVLDIRRCEEAIPYDDDGQVRKFLPDFLVETSDGILIVEVKSQVYPRSLSEKWHRYRESIPFKQDALKGFAEARGFEAVWYTPLTPGNRYRKLNVETYTLDG